MSYVDLMANDVWTEADIVNRGRALINAQVPEARQDELRTILLGHIAGMRPATPEELTEIALVQQTTEGVVLTNAASRADMALLSEVLAMEAALRRLAQPPVLLPLTIDSSDVTGKPVVLANPAIAIDAQERGDAQVLLDSASEAAQALHTLRNPVLENEGEQDAA